MKQKYYLTTAIAYTSSKPHIGNTYEAVLADAVARFKKEQGFDVYFQTGTDEHGQKIEEKAKEKGISPKEYVDQVSDEIKRIWKIMDVDYDYFIRTTDDIHVKQVQKIFEKFYKQGDIYKSSYEGWYCTPCESFWTESQLVDGKCPDCGREVKKANEEAYFFRMSKYADKLIEHINTHPDFIVPVSRKNEMMNNFLLPGLQDLCVSRTSFKWGIPVNFDDKHVVYVWLDALTNYITGIGFDVDGNHGEKYNKLWPADAHVIGKDIVRFHTIYWPIFLMALGEELPKQVFGHPWLIQEGGKMSKSKGNVLYADDLVDVYGVDAVRYYVLAGMPFDNDGLVGWNLMTEKINTELANVYGNLVKRTISMTNKYFGGVVESTGNYHEVDAELVDLAISTYPKVAKLVDEWKIADAIDEVFTLLRRANKYIDETAPWVLAKEQSTLPRLKQVLYNLTETIVMATSMLAPFMPSTSKLILSELGTTARSFDKLTTFGHYPSGNKVTDEPSTVFARLDPKEVETKAQEIALKYAPKVAEPKVEKEKKMPKELISIDEFAKVELCVAKVLQCEKVAKSDKLLCFQLQVGDEVRQVVSGIAQHYDPSYMIGKKVVLVKNLKPAKIRGVESNGMILCASDDNSVIFVTPEKDIESGSEVR